MRLKLPSSPQMCLELQADLIMSGTSYNDAVRGTEFDDLDADAEKQIEEAKRRMALLREDSLEEYLLEKGWVRRSPQPCVARYRKP